MAPNKRGAPEKKETSGGMIAIEEVEARGTGTEDHGDTYDPEHFWFSETRTLFTCVMFLTRLPCPAFTDHHPAFLMRSMLYFPVVGLVIGAWAATWFQAASVFWNPTISAAVSTMASVWLTGCFHEDGLADTFDGFGGGWGRAQILRIMKDSRVGTYALIGSAIILLLKVHALAALGPGAAPVALLVGHTIGRWVSLPLIFFSVYIEDEEDAKRGMYNWFAQCQTLLTPTRLALATAFTSAVAFALMPPLQALFALAMCTAVVIAAYQYGKAMIGGVVGDFLGASIAVSEVLLYLMLAADTSKALEADGLWKLLLLVAVAAAPVIYSRRIVEFKSSC